MDQLLDISTVPIKIDITVNRAKLAPSDNEISKIEGASVLKAKPVKSESESRALAEQASRRKDVFVQSNDDGFRVSYQATAKLSSGAAPVGKNISSEELAEIQSTRSIDRVMSEFAASKPGSMSWSDGTLNLSYSAEQLGIDWEAVDTVGFEFTPGSIDIKVEQLPQVNIEYTGGPIYVPRSADPRLDTKA